MAILKSEAVVLRSWKFGETSQILSLLTRDYGKVRVMAKGARGPKSKFKGCLESMTHIGIVYYEKPTRDLQLLSQTHLIDPHLGMIGDMERSTLGMAAAELIDRAVIGKEGTREIFYLFVSTLAALNKQTGFLEAILWYFQSHFIDLMGYKPTWDACLVCRSSLGREGGYFQPESGGLLCGKCGSHHGGLVVQGETLEVLYWLQGDNLDEAARLNPEASQKAEIRKMFDLYFRTHIENLRKIRSLELYYQLAS